MEALQAFVTEWVNSCILLNFYNTERQTVAFIVKLRLRSCRAVSHKRYFACKITPAELPAKTSLCHRRTSYQESNTCYRLQMALGVLKNGEDMPTILGQFMVSFLQKQPFSRLDVVEEQFYLLIHPDRSVSTVCNANVMETSKKGAQGRSWEQNFLSQSAKLAILSHFLKAFFKSTNCEEQAGR